MPPYNNITARRKFLGNALKITGAAMLTYVPLGSFANKLTAFNQQVTVGDIMDMFINQVKGVPFANTVDTLKTGSRETVVTGVVTAMFATIDVIRKTIAIGANFIIAHEPTFYNHQDSTQWLENNEVYRYKAALLKEHGIAVWRNHDYIHSIHPDGVMQGLVTELGWGSYGKPDQFVYNFPAAVSLQTLIQNLKTKLSITAVRYVGNLGQPCKKILLIPGAAGGAKHIGGIETYKPDVLVCGEISEWETAEYVRDARAAGKQLALVVLGHIASEEAGSIYMKNWLSQKFPGIKATFIPAGNSLSFL